MALGMKFRQPPPHTCNEILKILSCLQNYGIAQRGRSKWEYLRVLRKEVLRLSLKYYHLLWEMRFEVGHLKISRSLVGDKKEHPGQKEQHVQKPV